MKTLLFTNPSTLWSRPLADGGENPYFEVAGGTVRETLQDGTSACLVDQEYVVPEARPLPLRTFHGKVSPTIWRLLGEASELLYWRRETRVCARCGAALFRDETERAMRCPSCGGLFYPRLNPAVITLVTRGEDVLLEWKVHGSCWGLMAGFVEAGESLEEAAIREIREEAGIEVRNIVYRCSQPWPYPNSLMAGFRAEYASGEARPDGVEIEKVQWFNRTNLPEELPRPWSIAYRLLNEWR
ncbi:MAG: NAD(+) diphosphatase [Kiritimatiellae bacterium]|nr:NAD(+) diphosphatase [Kiritimatiellia bacterium]